MRARRQGLSDKQIPVAKEMIDKLGWTVEQVALHFNVTEESLKDMAPKPKTTPKPKAKTKEPSVRKKTKRAGSPHGEQD